MQPRLLVLIALSAVVLPSVARAAAAAAGPDLRLTPTGSFFTRFELRRGYTAAPTKPGLDGSDLVRYRARLGLVTAATLTDWLEVRARFVPQAGGFWHVGGDSLDDVALGLHEGVFQVVTAPLTLDVGRFELAYGDQLVIGPVGWHHLGRSFDGARCHVTAFPETLWFDVFFTVLGEGFENDLTAGAPALGQDYGAGDQYFLGLYLGLAPLLGGVELDLYVLSRIWPETDESGVSLEGAGDVTVGARTKGRAALVDWRVEAGVQLGERRLAAGAAASVLAWQADAEVGVNLAGDVLRLGLEGFVASGDDPSTGDVEGWDQLYPTAHKWLGYMDVVPARSNIAGGVLHVSWQAHELLRLFLDGHAFLRLEESAAAAGDDGYLGLEADVGAVVTLAKGLTFRAGYGLFLPSGDAVDDDPLHFAEAEARYEF